MANPQPPDLSKPLRRPSERLALVEHIAATPTLQENEYLEWKSAYDLSKRPEAGKVAKQLIGFANRDPTRASRFTGGHAYVLIGVEAGRLHGIEVWDSADVESWLSPFVGPDLIYDVHYVSAQGHDVLVLEVDPPKRGDGVFCLQATTGDERWTLTEGTVFVRRGGKTEVANAHEIGVLSGRAGQSAAATELALEVVADTADLMPLDPLFLEPSNRDGLLKRQEARLLKGVPAATPLLPSISESRTVGQFREEVRRYLIEIKEEWPTFALARFVEANEPQLKLEVNNTSDDNFEDVVVEVNLPLAPARVSADPTEAVAQLAPPEEPRRWGAFPAPKIPPGVFAANDSGGTVIVSDGDGARVRFPSLHVYPRTRHPLPPLTLALGPELAGAILAASWRATASNTRGQVAGQVELQVPDKAD
jgi:Putative DNA-binding domain